jgi:isoquinoline 1-oxidoreductase subunit alpha
VRAAATLEAREHRADFRVGGIRIAFEAGDGGPIQSCQVPAASAVGQQITTIEGLAPAGAALTAVQQAWIEEDVAQCGYCQAGQIMRATALLKSTPQPSDDEIDAAMAANLCRCGTYVRIRKAIHSAAAKIAKAGGAA